MNIRQILLPSLALAFALVGFCVYIVAGPTESTARTSAPPSRASQAFVAVSIVQGQVEIRSTDGIWTPARRGALLGPGDTIRTGADGQAELLLRNGGGRLRLDRNTAFSPDGRVSSPRGTVTEGSLWADVKASRGQENSFVLNSAVSRTQAQAATFRLHVLKPDSVQISVYKGHARLTNPPSPSDLPDSEKWLNIPAGRALALTPHQPPVWGEIDTGEDWKDGWQTRRDQTPDPRTETEEKPSGQQALHRSLKNINPEIYLSVEVELKSDQETSKEQQAQIQKIKIRSKDWDRLAPYKKVELLNDTFTLLKRKYPNIRHSVILEFDDGRPDLELKYASSLNG